MPDTLTVERANALFAEALPAYGRVRSVMRFAEGSVTGAYRVDFAADDAAPVVVKVYEPDDVWNAVKEVRSLRFLTEHGIDVSPRALGFSKAAGALDGRSCVVSSLRPGRMLSEVDGELTAAQRQEIYRQLGVVLARLHAIPVDEYGYINGRIFNPMPDNRAHMNRVFDRELRRFREGGGDPVLADRIAAYVADRESVLDDCERPVYCHGDVHEPNLLVDVAADGACTLTGLLDPLNMHAGDALVEFVRLDTFSLGGDATKIAGLLAGYGTPAVGRQPREPPDAWPGAWRPRMALYRVALALELYNWFTITGETSHLASIEDGLRELTREP